jgi:transcriptional regulator with XRE-family HTH domain
MDYAERMRGIREDADLTQTKIAEILHVCQRTYSDHEIKKSRIPLESMLKLAKFYNVDMNYICGISNEVRTYPTK